MGAILKRQNLDGTFGFKVSIRKDGVHETKTFHTEEDAHLYQKYKDRLILNKKNFDVVLKDRITLAEIFDLKSKTMKSPDRRTKDNIKNSRERFLNIFGKEAIFSEITLAQWKDSAKHLFKMDVYRGARNEKGRRKMSVKTLRNIFAHVSSSVSYARSLGVEIENHPLTVIQTFISVMEREEKKE